MIIEVPDAEIASLSLTSEKARVELAIGLYSGGKITLGRGGRIAGVSTTAFMGELDKRGICLNYTAEDAKQDIMAVRERHGE